VTSGLGGGRGRGRGQARAVGHGSGGGGERWRCVRVSGLARGYFLCEKSLTFSGLSIFGGPGEKPPKITLLSVAQGFSATHGLIFSGPRLAAENDSILVSR
jgi:hypothetical protein